MKLFSPSLCGAQEAPVQYGDPRMICHFSLVWLAPLHGENVCPLRSSRWLRTDLLQVIHVLRKSGWNGILVDNLSLCIPQRKQPWLWLCGGTWLDPARSSASVLSEVPSACPGSSKKESEIPVHFTQTTNQLSNLNDFPSLLHVGCIWISELEVKGSKNVITSPLRHLVLQGQFTGNTYLYFRNWGREKWINNAQIFLFCSKKCFHRFFLVWFGDFFIIILLRHCKCQTFDSGIHI